jgi:hypothetical protein
MLLKFTSPIGCRECRAHRRRIVEGKLGGRRSISSSLSSCSGVPRLRDDEGGRNNKAKRPALTAEVSQSTTLFPPVQSDVVSSTFGTQPRYRSTWVSASESPECVGQHETAGPSQVLPANLVNCPCGACTWVLAGKGKDIACRCMLPGAEALMARKYEGACFHTLFPTASLPMMISDNFLVTTTASWSRTFFAFYLSVRPCNKERKKNGLRSHPAFVITIANVNRCTIQNSFIQSASMLAIGRANCLHCRSCCHRR